MSASLRSLLGLLLLGAGAIGLALLLLLDLPLVMGTMILIIAIISLIIAALIIIGAISAIPLYLIKRGSSSEPADSYKLEDIRPIKEDERR